ncbi:MAG TPA: hypothetical protein VHE79_01070 [Spirochaetia bacterium]
MVKTTRAVMAGLVFFLASAALFAAGGAGGMGLGYQGFDASGRGTLSTMGYGYGTSRDGNRIGGFGMSILSTTGEQDGGVGGILLGHEWREGAGVGAITFLGGAGGVGDNAGGYMILFGEVDLELGLRVTRWMQLTGYVGYQVWGNLIPGPAFTLLTSYSPIVGVRIAWGGLY